MASRRTVTYYSDLSGVEIVNEDATVWFSLDGTDYEIDLTSVEQAVLREALAPFIAAAGVITQPNEGQPVAVRDTSSGVPPPGVLRAWALENGFDVPARGRLPDAVREAYVAASSHQEMASIKRLLDPVSKLA